MHEAGGVRVVLLFPEWDGMSGGAVWEDLKMGVEHLTTWKRIAQCVAAGNGQLIAPTAVAPAGDAEADLLKAGADMLTQTPELAAWLRHVRGDNAARWGAVDDPRAAELAAAWAAHGTEGIVAAVFGPGGLLASDWVPTAEDHAMLDVAFGGGD